MTSDFNTIQADSGVLRLGPTAFRILPIV